MRLIWPLIFWAALVVGTAAYAQQMNPQALVNAAGPGTPPTCDASHRGTVFFTANAAGVKDTYQVCAKDATDAYAWRVLY